MQTERNIWLRVLSMILTLALLISCVPNQVYAMAGEALADLLEATDTAVLQPNATPDPVLSTAHIVAEDESRRGETYKEYVMNNGLRLATVYSSAIHYESNGQWKDIDNTLVSAVSGGKAVYQNAAGAWSVKFPQRLSGSDMISITKDSHTVQFGMAGEMRSTGDLVVASIGEIGRGETTGTLAISSAQVATAQIQQIDLTAARAAAEHPETVLEKLSSRLTYANVYPNTNVVYDLQGNQLKESVVLQRYDASLWGYRYTLNTGDLVPILRQDQQIDLCHPKTNEVILTMPAPYMQDNNGETSYDVEVSLTRNGSNYLLSYYLPRAWLADTNRTWPVILDPIVSMYGDYNIVKDRTVCESATESYTDLTLECGHSNNRGVMRFFVEFTDLPELSSAEVILDAKITLKKPTNGTSDTVIEVHKIEEPWTSSGLSWTNMPRYNSNVVDYVVCKAAGTYAWNITSLVREWYNGDNNGILFKASQDIENARNNNWKQFYSSDSGPTASNLPALVITYQDHNGLEDYWSYSSVSAGRAGTGYVNLFTGNLTWVRGDLGFDGNRMPVSISHVYNANDSQRNDFGVGFGWRTNYNQTVTSPSSGVYVWEDGDGTRHYFYQAKDSSGNVIANTYLDEDGLHLTLTTGGSGNQKYQLTDQYGNKSYFDTAGRLRKMENNQQEKSSIEISYTTGNLIDTITDGVDRVYQFHYPSGLLSKISYMGSGNTELTYVLYTYDEDAQLIGIEDKKPSETSEAFITSYEYDGNGLLTKATDVTGYNILYTYFTGYTNRINLVREYNGTTLGNFMSFEYGTHYAKTTDHKQYETYYQFNDWGNVVAVHDSDGHTQYTKYALNDVNDPIPNTVEPHQIVEVFDIGGAVNNISQDSSFEGNVLLWGYSNSAVKPILTDDYAYHGGQSVKIMAATNERVQTLYDSGQGIEPGETYTFSAYILLVGNGAEVTISLGPSNEDYRATNTIKDVTDQWVRVQVSYTNEGTEARYIIPRISITSGTAYVDCVQFEKADVASDYCAIENGDAQTYTLDNITYFNGWKTMDGLPANDYYAETTAANSALGAGALRIDGEPEKIKYITQSIGGSGNAGDVFVLSGWAKANAAPLGEYRDPAWEENRVEMREFGLKLVFQHEGNEFTQYYISFDPDISDERWQYAATTIIAPAAYKQVSVQVVYSHQVNVAFFDGIQLYKRRCSTSYAYDENKNLVSETNILGQKTEYYYHDNGIDLESVNPSVGSDVYYSYDAFHNVTYMAETVTDPENVTCTTVYQYEYNAHGNVTSITVLQDSTAENSEPLRQKSLTAYTADGNYITSSTNTYDETTYYGYDLETGLLLWVQNPGDTVDTRTEYTYDDMYRVIGTSTSPNQNAEMSVSYTYYQDLLTTITTGSNTTYTITYGDFNLRKSVKVSNHTLATYRYSHDNPNASDNDKRNHNLERLDYGNGDSVEYTYDYLGRVTREKYYENGSASISRVIDYVYDSTGALACMKDSATGIVTKCYYENGGRVATVEETDNETFWHIFRYFFDGNGNVIAVQEYTDFRGAGLSNGTTNAIGYEHISQHQYLYDHKNRLASVMASNAQKDYVYDGFDRLIEETVSKTEGDTITTILSNKYTYENITVIEDGNISEYTGNRVSKVEIESNGLQRVYEYSYDTNGNIISINNEAVTYEYDSANQLIQEYNSYTNRIFQWTYDNAGNITSKTEINLETGKSTTHNYGYTDDTWGDLLTSYDRKSFLYDNSGNLTNDGTWTYTWKQGRQLASMSKDTENWVFEYNANGMRTKRYDNNRIYNYVYSGSQLTAMVYSWHKFFITYDAAGRPLTLEYHDTYGCQKHHGGSCGSRCETFYYVTNLQGDVIALLDSSGNIEAAYSYDAWGNPIDTPSSWIGNMNPLRYRGYVYDSETGLYYLQSRYYNPEIGRFISADSYVSTGDGILGNNMFAYCHNNPIMFADPTGECLLTAIIIGAIAGAIIGGAIGGTVAYNSAKSSGLEGSDLFWATASGVGKGALIGSALGSLAGATGGVLATYELGSIAATAMITATANITARAFEVTALQTKKSLNDGDNGWQVANDCISALFSNGLNIMSPALTKTGATIGTYLFVDITKHRVIPLGFKSFLESTGGKALGYGLAALAWADAINSMKSADPIARAEKRGYVLI